VASQSRRLPPWGIVAVAGLLAGLFDIVFAFVFYGSQGAGPELILRFIASGILGRSAFAGGYAPVALGALLHFFIALCAAALYWSVSRRYPLLVRRPLACGALFGIMVYSVMHFIVLPLSRIGFRLPSLHDAIGELFSHIVLFGMVIALGAARAHSVSNQRSEPS
jgi:hypothetical protein